MDWISVKDKLPEKDIIVLAFDGTYIETMQYWYDEEGKQIWFSPPAPPKDNVTHWMPLPKPPEEYGME